MIDRHLDTEAAEIYRQLYGRCADMLNTPLAIEQKTHPLKLGLQVARYLGWFLTPSGTDIPYSRVIIAGVDGKEMQHSVPFLVGALQCVGGQVEDEETGRSIDTLILGIKGLRKNIRGPKEIVVLVQGAGNRLILRNDGGYSRVTFDENYLTHPEFAETMVDTNEARAWQGMLKSFRPH